MMLETQVTIAESHGASGRKALRAIGWSELTARINAARDLRQVLRSDATLMTASFGDAAAGYFASPDQSKRAVNPDALEGSKTRQAMELVSEGETEEGAEKST